MRIYFFKKVTAISALFLISLLYSGCSTVMTRPFPDLDGDLKIGVTDKRANSGDWDEGSYHLDKANVCFSKAEGDKGASDAQVLFGIIGRAIAVGDEAGSLKEMIKGDEGTFSLDLGSMTREALKNELGSIKNAERFSTDDDWNSAPIQITPYVVFSFVDKEKAHLWVVLHLEWIDQGSKQNKWNCRYIAGLGDSRPLTGETGWTSNQGELLQTTVKKDIRVALQVMLDDLQGKLRSDDVPKDYVGAQWMFHKSPYFVQAQKLKTTDDWDVYLPQVEDEEYFAGMNIAPKDFSLPMPVTEKNAWGN